MKGLGLRLYTDEDVDAKLAFQLRRLGYDVVSCQEEGNAGHGYPDDWQLAYAVAAGRAILSHNITDYMAIDAAWRVAGRAHHGILVVEQRIRLGELVRRTQHCLDTVSPVEQRNLARYLAR